MVIGTMRIRSEKLREHQYKKGYGRSLEGKRVEWDGDDNVSICGEQVKQAMVESAREVCVLNESGEKEPKEGVVE